MQLADIVECVALVERHRRSMDENGARFMLFFRQHGLRKGRSNEMQLSWREINWAYHSTSQDILVDFVSRQDHGGMLWEHARESGIFMWLSDIKTLVSAFWRWQVWYARLEMLTQSTEIAVRGHRQKRIHQGRRKKPGRLQPVLSRAPKEGSASGALAHGKLE